MASATQGAPIVSRMLARVAAASSASDAAFFVKLDHEFRATVAAVERLTPTIVEVVVHAPAAARRFRPGSVLSPAEFRDAGGAWSTGRVSRWKVSR